MDTPILSHITSEEYLDVYEPSEDSFLMLDALEKEMDNIRNMDPLVCLELGPGSGINITAFSKVFKKCFCYCVDINPKACEISYATGKINNRPIDCVNGDLMTNIKNNCADVIIFNPPYVVTDSSEIYSDDINRSWSGGIKGREVIDRFLPQLPRVLSDTGVCYMIIIEENCFKEIEGIMRKLKFRTSIVLERRARNEKLKVLKFERIKKTKYC